MKIMNKICDKLSIFRKNITNIYIYIYIYGFAKEKKGGCLLTNNNLSLQMKGGYC